MNCHHCDTLLNYAGVKPDLLSFVCDADLDFLLILPWNIMTEVKQQNAMLAAQGIKFVTALPVIKIS